MSNPMLGAALRYAEMGFAVFPLKPRDKTPLTEHGFKNATSDATQIKRWWKRCPEANIGLATGAISGNICVLDIDVDEEKGIDGSDTLSEWERNNGRLPSTAIAITGRGGYHYYYRITEEIKNRTNILEGIDFRGTGGYVVAPPSVHSNGNEYEWEFDIDETPVADADEIVLKLLETARKSSKPIEEREKLDVTALINAGGRNEGLFKVGAHYQSLSFSDSDIHSMLVAKNIEFCKPPLEDDEVEKIYGSVIQLPKGKSKEFIEAQAQAQQEKSTKGKGKRETINEIVETVLNDEKLGKGLRYNTLAYAPWFCGVLPWSTSEEPIQKRWSDVDDANFQAYMETEYGFSSEKKMMKALSIVMDKNKFSPIVEHLDSLRGTWDGVKRVDRLLQDFLGADDTQLTRSMMRMFMYGAIARAYTPGSQFDYMLVLVGDQGIGKSTFFRRLAMHDVWFDGNFNTIDGDKAVERLRGMWIVEMSEMLAQKRSKDVEAMKSFITAREDNYRAPYDKRTLARPRQCVFAGSTNQKMFLTDITGNRRFFPIQTHPKKIKKDLFEDGIEEYFSQAWAEALHDYFEGNKKLVLPKEQTETLMKIQSDFTEEVVEVGMIQEYLDNLQYNRTCVLDIWQNGMHEFGRPDRKTTNMIHMLMGTMVQGWTATSGKKRCRDFGVQRCYEREREGWEEAENADF